MKRKHILILLLIIQFSACKSIQTRNNWLDGQWTGIGFQKDLVEDNSWSIETTINLKKRQFTINYPSIGCSGKWELLELSKHKAIFTETIDNINICTNHGKVILTKVDANHISFSYYLQNESTVASFSTLKRRN